MNDIFLSNGAFFLHLAHRRMDIALAVAAIRLLDGADAKVGAGYRRS